MPKFPRLCAAAAAGVLLSFAGTAIAGECPADQVGVILRQVKEVAGGLTEPNRVEDDVLHLSWGDGQ